MYRFLAIGVVCVTLTGCTQYWAKPGGTEAEFEATKAACQGKSYAQFPPVMQPVQVSSGYVTPMQTVCNPVGYAVSCYTVGGQYSPPAYVMVDMNQSGRDAGFRSCLFEAGWQPMKNREEAEAVTNSPRQPPPPSTQRK